MPLRPRAFLLIALGALLLAAHPAHGQQPLRVAYLALPPRPDESGMVPDHMASVIGSLGVQARPLLADARAGKLTLSSTDVLVLGSWSNYEDPVQKTLVLSRETIRAFINGGGVVVMFAQFWSRNVAAEKLLPDLKQPQERRTFGFLEPEFKLDYSPQHYDSVVMVHSHHPLLSQPKTILPDRIGKWNGCWAAGVDTPVGAPGSRIILGHRYKLAFPWLQEVSIGRGLAILCAGAVDRVKSDSNEESRTLLGDLLENAFDRARRVREKSAEKFEPTFKEMPTTSPEVVTDAEDWKAFEARVDSAVDRGVEWLKKRQKEDGSFGGFNTNFGAEKWVTGPTSLAVMALLASGVSKHEAVIQKAFDFLLANTPSSTYENGLFLSALEHKASPSGERIEFLRLPPAERVNFTFKRTLAPKDREAMERAADWLVKARYRGVWSYLAYPKTADASNTQYGALGLLSAKRCGITVPREAFEKLVDTYLSFQSKANGTRPYAQPLGAVDPHAWPKFEMRAMPYGWWNYNPLHRESVGRGTTDCIGIAVLMLGLDGISGDGPGDQRKPKVAAAVDMAVNHLDSIFRVDIQPAAGEFFPDYYWLYTLERSMVLTDARFVGRHDWYREAGEFLVDIQRRSGGWDTPGAQNRNDTIQTSFALLTLRRATVPSRTTLK